MKYCVIKDTTTTISANNPDEVMLKDAISSGFTSDQVEIISEQVYQDRIENSPKKPIEKTQIEIMQETIDMLILSLLGGA